MADKIENKNPQNYDKLTENQIFERIKEDLTPIQESLSEKKITVDEAKSELQKINERLQWSNLEKKDKKEIWKAFEKLINLEKNIDETALKDEVNEIINLLETLTKKDLANLEKNIKQKHTSQKFEQESKKETQYSSADRWRKDSSDQFNSTVHEAAKDKNPFARKIGERMEYLMS